METGTVKKVVLAKNFGFIVTANSPDVFFHSSVLDAALDFDETLVERRVSYVAVSVPRGLKATFVGPAD